MTGTLRRKSEIKALDPLWQSVRQDAETLSAEEPVMAGLALVTVLNHETFESALAFRLAARLDHGDLPGDLIRQTFEDVLVTNPEIGESARTDLSATLERDPACHRAIEPLLYFKGYHAIQTHRFAHALWNNGRRDLALYLQSRSSLIFQTDINPNVPVGKGIMLDHGTGVVIGETAVIGDDVSILQGVTLGGTGKEDGDRHPKVECGVLIGAGAKILGNITIGQGARIAAGSVVLNPVPAHTTVAGVPAKVIGEAGCAQPALSMNQMLKAQDDKA